MSDGLNCIACLKPLAWGDRYYSDQSGGFIHADCCGPERESYVNGDGEPLGPNDPIPEPSIWEADRKVELTADFAKALPGGCLDDSTFEQIETVLDRLNAPCRGPRGAWLTLPERIAGLAPSLDAVQRVLTERRRQIEVEGWSSEHDDEYAAGELAAAAAAYAFNAYVTTTPRYLTADPLGFWPWAPSWWKPRSALEDLSRAAALIIAEMERLDRLSTSHMEGQS